MSTDNAEYRELLKSCHKIHVELWRIVSQVPADYVYQAKIDSVPTCTYWKPGDEGEPGEPDCVIGRLLHSLGVDGQTLRDIDCSADDESSGFWELYEAGRFHDLFPRPVAKMLSVVQSAQDNGTPWHRLPQIADMWWAGYCFAVKGQA